MLVMTKRILIIEDDKYLRLALLEILSQFGLLEEASSFYEAQNLLLKNHYDIVVSDIELGDGLSFELLPLIRRKGSQCLVLSSHQEVDFIEKAYEAGAQHFLAKNQMRLQLPHYMNLLCHTHKKDLDLFFENDFITANESLKKEISKLAEVNLTNRNILITGPTGVGKSHLGKLIHKLSRSPGNLIHINCSEIPENLLEAELFGHTKGAFTGAEKARVGKLTSASKGILFLDEVGTMPMSMQQKLLKALDEKTFYPVGSDVPQKIDFTLITASCEDLQEKIQNKTFREDLFYRINGISIKIPSLSERKEDIELLISKFIQNSPRKFIIKEEAIELLKQKPWAGNIRELNKFLERIHDSEIGIVRKEDIDQSQQGPEKDISLPDPNDILHLGLKSYIAQLEKMAVEASMKRNNGKVTECIKELRISVSAFYRILNSH